MIKIKIELDDRQTIRSITAEGHSAFSEKGTDVVCASVSTLIYSYYLAISSILPGNVDFTDNKNELKIVLNDFSGDYSGEVRGIALFLIKGLKLVEKNFKKNLKIIIKR